MSRSAGSLEHPSRSVREAAARLEAIYLWLQQVNGFAPRGAAKDWWYTPTHQAPSDGVRLADAMIERRTYQIGVEPPGM